MKGLGLGGDPRARVGRGSPILGMGFLWQGPGSLGMGGDLLARLGRAYFGLGGDPLGLRRRIGRVRKRGPFFCVSQLLSQAGGVLRRPAEY